MREILFRGKTSQGKWVYGSLIQADEYCCILEDESKVHPMHWPYLDPDLGIFDGRATPVDPETIGQYTGKDDVDGKKIFDGDIVQFCEDDKYTFEVIYNGCEWLLVNDFDSRLKHYRCNLLNFHQLKVIGNLFDNTKLLERKE